MIGVRVLGAVELTAGRESAGQESLAIKQPLARALAVRLALARGEAVADDILIRDLNWPWDNPQPP